MSTAGVLRGLIESRKREGWSYRKIAKQTGGRLTSSQVHKWATEPKKHAPTRDQLEALAQGLQMPKEVIFEAANKDWTTPPELIKAENDGSVAVIASMLRELRPEDIDQVHAVVDTIYRRMKEEERRRANG